MNKGYMVYEERAPYDTWLKVVLGGVTLLTLGLGFWLLTEDIEGAFAMFGITAFDLALFYFILPRKYQVHSDRLTVVMGPPLSLSVPFSSISEVRPAPGRYAMGYNGLRFATSSKNVLEIKRRRGLNMVISPASEMFLEQLNRAMKDY